MCVFLSLKVEKSEDGQGTKAFSKSHFSHFGKINQYILHLFFYLFKS